MSVTLQCPCGHRHSITEETNDTGIEMVAVILKLATYPPCSVCGKKEWKILPRANPMSDRLSPERDK
jgi:hypothetical protein